MTFSILCDHLTAFFHGKRNKQQESYIHYLWPFKLWTRRPISTSQSFTVESKEALHKKLKVWMKKTGARNIRVKKPQNKVLIVWYSGYSSRVWRDVEHEAKSYKPKLLNRQCYMQIAKYGHIEENCRDSIKKARVGANNRVS